MRACTPAFPEDEDMHDPKENLKDSEITKQIKEEKKSISRDIKRLKEPFGSELSDKWKELERLVAPSKEQFCYICNKKKGTIENTCYHYICTSCLTS